MEWCPRSTHLAPHKKGARGRTCPECRFFLMRQQVQEKAAQEATEGHQSRLF